MVKFEYGEKQCLDIQLRKCQSLCWPSNPTSVKRYFPARAENPNIGEAVIKSIHCRLLCGGTVNWTVIGTNTTSTEVCVCHPSQTRSVCMAKSLVTARVVYGGGCAGWLMGGGDRVSGWHLKHMRDLANYPPVWHSWSPSAVLELVKWSQGRWHTEVAYKCWYFSECTPSHLFFFFHPWKFSDWAPTRRSVMVSITGPAVSDHADRSEPSVKINSLIEHSGRVSIKTSGAQYCFMVYLHFKAWFNYPGSREPPQWSSLARRPHTTSCH